MATGSAHLHILTTKEGAAWASVTVDPAHRRQGIGGEIGRRLLDHLRASGATNVQSFFRWTEEGERWATSRGWSKLLGCPLIALDPRVVPEPVLGPGYRCVSMAELAPEAVYEAAREAALDEPTPVPYDNVQFDMLLCVASTASSVSSRSASKCSSAAISRGAPSRRCRSGDSVRGHSRTLTQARSELSGRSLESRRAQTSCGLLGCAAGSVRGASCMRWWKRPRCPPRCGRCRGDGQVYACGLEHARLSGRKPLSDSRRLPGEDPCRDVPAEEPSHPAQGLRPWSSGGRIPHLDRLHRVHGE
jgi:acetyltransferase (GNAT) family protein